MRLLIALLPALVLSACASNGPAAGGAEEEAGCVFVTMSTSEGDIELELFPSRAPVTVANFLKYVDRGAYDGKTFHRVVEDFVIQGGGWTPDLQERAKADAAAGHADVPIRNEWQNGLKNERGAIAMAREEAPDTATREFYINVQDNPKLDTARPTTGGAGYAVFGRVVEGMDVVDRIRHLPTAPREVPGVTDGSMGNVPVKAVVITSVRRTGK
jgi:cyclophilin family peptidyl-prolyl cis-trans isomerase